MGDRKIYRVLVAEDEILQRENLTKKIESFSDNFKVVYGARNGQEALNYLRSNPVDIVFTDIVMPIMDGMEFLSKATELKPELIYVILSGYSEFKYAQKAISYGVKEYLLKPVMKEEIFSLLARLSNQSDIQIRPQREINIKALLSSRFQPAFLEGFRDASFSLALMRIGHFAQNYRNMQDFEDIFDSFWNDLDMRRSLEHISDEMKMSVPYFLNSEVPNECYIVFFNEGIRGEGFREYLERLYAHLTAGHIYPPIVFAYCSHELRADEMYQGQKMLHRLYNERYVPWKPQFLEYGRRTEAMLYNKNVTSVNAEDVIRALLVGNQGEFRKLLPGLLKSWQEQRIPFYQYYQNLVFLLKTLYGRMPQETYVPWEEFQKNVLLNFCVSVSFEEFAQNLTDVFCDCKGAAGAEESMEEIVYKIKKFMDTYYFEYINVNDVADRFNISYSYLLRRFKEEYGKSPVKYLIDLRIQAAIRQMQQNPDMELQKIGEIVGYTDYFYFSKLFKKYTGKTPTSYRKMILGNQEE